MIKLIIYNLRNTSYYLRNLDFLLTRDSDLITVTNEAVKATSLDNIQKDSYMPVLIY